MTTFVNTCTGPDEVDVSASNSEAGSDQWSSMQTPVGTGTLKYDAAASVSGGSSIRLSSPASGDQAAARWQDSAPFTVLSSRVYFGMVALPTSGTLTFWQMQSTSSVRSLGLSIGADGRFYSSDSLASGAGYDQSSELLQPDIWYRAEIVMTSQTNYRVDVFEGHSLTKQTGLSLASASATLTANTQRVVLGKPGGSGVGTIFLDEIKNISGQAINIGPIATGAVHFDIVGNYDADSSLVSGWTVDCTASTGTVTMQQLGGTSTTFGETGAGTKIFNIANPGNSDNLIFQVSAVTGGVTSTTSFTLQRGSGASPSGNKFRYTFQGGSPSVIGNWK